MDSGDAIRIITKYLQKHGAALVQAQAVDERVDHHWHNSRHNYYTGGMIKYTMEIQFADIEGFHNLAKDLEYVEQHKNAKDIRDNNKTVKDAYEQYMILLKLHGG